MNVFEIICFCPGCGSTQTLEVLALRRCSRLRAGVANTLRLDLAELALDVGEKESVLIERRFDPFQTFFMS